MAISTIPWGHDWPPATSREAEEKNWGYWQNRINRASLVMLTEEGIVSPEDADIDQCSEILCPKFICNSECSREGRSIPMNVCACISRGQSANMKVNVICLILFAAKLCSVFRIIFKS